MWFFLGIACMCFTFAAGIVFSFIVVLFTNAFVNNFKLRAQLARKQKPTTIDPPEAIPVTVTVRAP